MKIKEIFKNIFKGIRIENDTRADIIEAILIDTKDVENCRINHLSTDTQEVKMKIKDKYFLKPGDIIIATMPSEKTCHVGFVPFGMYSDIKAIIKKNFIVLRDINELYEPEFVAEYLEHIGINKYFDTNKKSIYGEKQALTILDVEDIDIPKISLKKQQEFLNLINPINERSLLYKQLIKNDNLIKNQVIKELIDNEEQY